MLVLDANILMRAVLGKHARSLIARYYATTWKTPVFLLARPQRKIRFKPTCLSGLKTTAYGLISSWNGAPQAPPQPWILMATHNTQASSENQFGPYPSPELVGNIADKVG